MGKPDPFGVGVYGGDSGLLAAAAAHPIPRSKGVPVKKDNWIALGFSVVALVLRLPYASQYLYHWDSVNYALSLDHYDVRLHQPHPPGYFLYSMLGKLVNYAFQDANAALVAISILFSALGIGALYLLGLGLVNRPVAFATALLGLSSPLLWFEGEVALNYSLDFFLVSVIGLLFIKQWQGDHSLWFWSALMLGITGGVRLHDVVFLGPLWLLSLVKLNWKQRLLSLVTLGLVVLAWFIPMAALSGGLQGYIEAFQAESSAITSEASLFVYDQLGLNVSRLAIYLAYGLMGGLLPLVWGFIRLMRQWRTGIRHPLFLPFLLWLAPGILFFVLIHIRQAGHVILLLPVLLVMSGWSLITFGNLISKPKSTYWLVGGLFLLNLIFFLAAPKALFGSTRLPLQTPSRASLVQRDKFLGERIQFIQANFDPGKTAIIAGGLNIRHPDYYLRDFQRTDLSYRISEDWTSLPENVNTLIFFDDQIMPDLALNDLVRHEFTDGSMLRILKWGANEQLWISLSGLEIREK